MQTKLIIDFKLFLNGAQLFPTPQQYQALAQSIQKIMLGNDVNNVESEEPARALKQEKHRLLFSHRKNIVRWSKEEETLAYNLYLEGKKPKLITKLLTEQFGIKRNKSAVAQRLYALIQNRGLWVKAANPDEVVLSHEPELRSNETGGVDYLKAHQL